MRKKINRQSVPCLRPRPSAGPYYDGIDRYCLQLAVVSFIKPPVFSWSLREACALRLDRIALTTDSLVELVPAPGPGQPGPGGVRVLCPTCCSYATKRPCEWARARHVGVDRARVQHRLTVVDLQRVITCRQAAS